jgi:hypothetical protein
MEIEKNKSPSLMKDKLRAVLSTRSPNEWAELIKANISEEGLCYWLANIAIYSYRGEEAFGTDLDELATWYRADLNLQTSDELEAGFGIMGWPYRKGASDDAVPSILKRKESQIDRNAARFAKVPNHPEAYRYEQFHKRQAQ